MDSIIHKLLNISLLTIVLTLASCAHDRSVPKSAHLKNWTNPSHDAAVNLAHLNWWQKFNDPTLDDLIERAVKHNLLIKIAQGNLKAATGQLNTVKLSWLPSLNLLGGYVGSSTNTAIAPIGNLGILGGNGGFIGILPNYMINILGNSFLQQQAQHQQNIAKGQILTVRLAVVSQVVSAYFALLALNDTRKQYESLTNDIAELKTLNQNMQSRGMATQISVDALSSHQALIAGQLTLVEKNIAAANNALKQLIGEVPGIIEHTSTLTKINANQIIPGNLPMDVLANRPDIIIAREEYRVTNNGVGVAASAFFPIVSANAFFAKTAATATVLNGQVSNNIKTSQNYYAGYLTWILSPAAFGQIQTATGLKAAAIANYQRTVLAALHDVDNALTAHTSYSTKLQQDETALTSTEHAHNLKHALYEKGLNTKGELLLSQISTNTLKIDVIQTKLQKLIALVAVYQSMGGGFKLNALPDELIEDK